MEICRSDGSAGESGKDGGFSGFGGYREDAIRCLPANFEIVIEPISCGWIRAGVRGCERPFEVWVEFGLAYGADWFKGCRVDALETSVVGLKPEVVDVWRGAAL